MLIQRLSLTALRTRQGLFLAQQSASANLRAMGANPLLLALQIGVFLMCKQRLPELRTELYRIGTGAMVRRSERVRTADARNVGNAPL